MKSRALHIVNGDHLMQRIQGFGWGAEFVVWREMLCEGPSDIKIDTESAIKKRIQFLQKYYRITAEDYEKKFITQLRKLSTIKSYDEIVLWFDSDLFCQINMIAAISLVLRKMKKTTAVYLVGNLRENNKNDLKPLSLLSDAEILEYYDKRSLLDMNDLEFASYIWTIYCESNPAKIIGQIKKQSNFQYLAICLRAHLQRFPNMLTGLNTLEHNILQMVDTYEIQNMRQLLGYALEYQGYYGYGDVQMKRVLARLFQFFDQRKDRLYLSERGKLALKQKKNFYNTQKLDWYYGGVKKYDYLYNNETHHLLKL